MIVACSQPYFAPFPGFFYKIYRADVFVILDSVQFPRGTTWISRNRFKNDKGTLWLTVPVKKKGLGLQRINAVKIYHDGRWERKHLQSLKTAYAHAPYFKEHRALVEQMFEPERLVDLNLHIIHYILDYLGISTRIVLLSELDIDGRGTVLLLRICKALGASDFLVQKAAAKYLQLEQFENEAIRLHFINYPKLVYPQLWGDFIPNLSILDLIFNCGPKSLEILLG